MNADERRRLGEARARLDDLKARLLGHSEPVKRQVVRAKKRIDAARNKALELGGGSGEGTAARKRKGSTAKFTSSVPPAES